MDWKGQPISDSIEHVLNFDMIFTSGMYVKSAFQADVKHEKRGKASWKDMYI